MSGPEFDNTKEVITKAKQFEDKQDQEQNDKTPKGFEQKESYEDSNPKNREDILKNVSNAVVTDIKEIWDEIKNGDKATIESFVKILKGFDPNVNYNDGDISEEEIHSVVNKALGIQNIQEQTQDFASKYRGEISDKVVIGQLEDIKTLEESMKGHINIINKTKNERGEETNESNNMTMVERGKIANELSRFGLIIKAVQVTGTPLCFTIANVNNGKNVTVMKHSGRWTVECEDRKTDLGASYDNPEYTRDSIAETIVRITTKDHDEFYYNV